MATPVPLWPEGVGGETNAPPSAVLVGFSRHFGREICHEYIKDGIEPWLLVRSPDGVANQLDDLADHCRISPLEEISRFELERALKAVYAESDPVAFVYLSKSGPRGSPFLPDYPLVESLAVNLGGLRNLISILVELNCDKRPIPVTTLGGGYKDRPDPSKLALSVGKAVMHNFVLATTQAALHYGVELRTLVIDGWVRAEGPILSREVAETLVSMTTPGFAKRVVTMQEPPENQQRLF